MHKQIPVVSFTVAHNGRANVLTSEVEISTAFDLTSTRTPPQPRHKFAAIWDTGATGSVVTQKVVTDCGLKPIGMVRTHTASGERMAEVFLASVFLPNKVVIPQLRVTEGILAGGKEMLIGMDIIGRGDFAVTHMGGKTVMTFRMPSIERIDFVKQQPSAIQDGASEPLRRVGRNEPCPCGSGKKYKKCCGA